MSSTDSSELETRIELDSGSATRTARPRDPAGLDAAPERIDRFEILELVGTGGMGVVYRARDPRLGRDVALKLVRADLTPDEAARLRREARALAALSHPNVVQVFEVGEDRGRLYLTMEYVPGRTLRQWLPSQPPTAEIVARLLEAARGLAAAHAAGLLHRDIKPSNIYVGHDGRARLLDFGLAREQGEVSDGRRAAITSQLELEPGVGEPLTATGTVLGTPMYMAPEQLLGLPATKASDQFGLCVTAYEALLDEHPFRRRPPVPVGGELVVEPAAPGTDPLVARLRPLLLRGMSLRPEARWPSVEALIEALEQALVARRGLGLGGALAVVATAAAGAVALAAWLPRETPEPPPAACMRDASLAEAWNDERREALRSTLSGTGLEYAVDTAGTVIGQLDVHARAWEAARAEACDEATAAASGSVVPLEARLACLERQRATLVAVLDVLAEPDSQVMQRAAALVEGLESPARCNDGAYLRQRPAQPTDPAVLAAVAALEPLVDELQVERRSGRYDRALALVERLDRASEGVDHPPLRAEIDVGSGALLAQVGREADAAPRLERGFFAAKALGMDALAFEAALTLVLVDGRDDFEAGLAWVRHAETMLAASGDELRRARLRAHHGLLLEASGRGPEAITELEQAVALIESTPNAPTSLLTQGLVNLASVLGNHDLHREAEIHLRRALALRRAELGPRHPLLVSIAIGLGNALAAQDRTEEALALCEEGLRILDGAGGRRQPSAVGLLANKGSALRELGRFDEALAAFEEARELSLATKGPNLGLAGLDNSLSLVLQHLGRHDEALAALERALALRSELLGPEHPSLLPPMVNLGEALLELGRPEEAAPHLERALAISEGRGASDMDRMLTLIPAARLALAQGQTRVGLERAEHAVRLSSHVQAQAVHVSRARFELARALVAAGRERPRALALARDARDGLAEHRDGDGDVYDEIAAWLREQDPGAPAR